MRNLRSQLPKPCLRGRSRPRGGLLFLLSARMHPWQGASQGDHVEFQYSGRWVGVVGQLEQVLMLREDDIEELIMRDPVAFLELVDVDRTTAPSARFKMVKNFV